MEEAQDTEQIDAEASETVEERLAKLPRRLAGLQLEIELPKRLIERAEVAEAIVLCVDRPHLSSRVLAGALMLCWPSAQRRNGAPRYTGDLLAYGGAAYDFLLGHGATTSELLRAGGVAVALCLRAVTEQHQAQEGVRGNGVARGGSTSASSSPSSGTTTSLLARSESSNPGGSDS